MSGFIIQVKNLTKKYPDGLTTVKGISFDVKCGEVFGILGPNGAGKTTTLEMIEAIRKISEGEVLVNGINVSKKPKEVKKIIGIQLQSSNFLDKVTLAEQLTMFAAFYGHRINPNELLDRVNLKEKAKSFPEQLSGGQRQRFSIATALVHKPKVLFLDEPTTGLDPQSRINLWELVEDIKNQGITVILTTHYMEEAERLCDRLAIMDGGEIVALDTPKNLVQNLLDSGFKKEVTPKPADLQDVFINLTGKELRE